MNFTADFTAAATANLRDPSALVTIAWGDSNTDTNVTITSNDTNRIDRKGQVLNGFEFSGYKWYHLHDNLTINDDFRLCPETDGGPQMGWWSQTESDVSGEFATDPYLNITHDARDYTAISVIADDRYGQYPVDFIIDFFYAAGSDQITVTGNSQREYTAFFNQKEDVTGIRLTISKWSAPNAVIKITQFAGRFEEQYYRDDIIGMDILEESNSDTGVVPIGNVSSNELDISLINSDRRFSYGNTDSPFDTSLLANRRIKAWLGFKLKSTSIDQTGDVDGYIVEDGYGYMPWGVYWSRDWISTYRSQETTTSAFDITYRLSQFEYNKSKNFTGLAGDIINEIMTSARERIPDLNWQIRPEISSIVWSNVFFPITDYLTTLKSIMVATLSYSYVDRTGVLIIGSRLGTDILPEESIGLSEYFNYTSTPKTDELANTARVGYTTYALESSTDLHKDTSEKFTIPASGEITVYIKYNQSVALASSVSINLITVSGTPPNIGNADIYAVGAEITVTGSVGVEFRLELIGQPYALTENTETTAELPASVATYGVRELSITGNQLIKSEASARNLAQSVIALYGELRQDGSLTWPGSTLVGVGSTVEVTEFKSDIVEAKDYFLINRQKLSFDGSLKSELSLRRS